MRFYSMLGQTSQIVRSIRFALLLFAVSLPPVLNAAPEVEVMHWWYRGTDARSMQVLEDEFESRGGVWHNVAVEDSSDVLNTAVSRLAKGYAPTLVQWNSAWEVEQIRNLDLLASVDEDVFDFLQNTLMDNVLDMITVNGEIVAVPVDIHTENWLWFRTGNDTELTTEILSDWMDFLNHAELASEQGKIAIAVGDQAWQQRLLFNNILLGVAGKKLYERFYNQLDVSVFDEDQFLEALNIFTRLKRFSKSFGDGMWEQQVAAVASSRALATSMGDWAKGEFKNLGLRLGRDYDCSVAPGTTDNIILAMDVFVFGKVENVEEKQGQKLFIEVVTDPDVSETFNYLKGSLPPLRKISTGVLDKCNQKAYVTLSKKGSAIKPHASIGDRGFVKKLDHLISLLWTGEKSVEQWTDDLTVVVETEIKKRSSSENNFTN